MTGPRTIIAGIDVPSIEFSTVPLVGKINFVRTVVFLVISVVVVVRTRSVLVVAVVVADWLGFLVLSSVLERLLVIGGDRVGLSVVTSGIDFEPRG